MIGIFLASIGTFFEEVSDIIGRKKVLEKKESIYAMGFLHMFWATIFFLIFIIFKNDAFVFRSASLPTFSLRLLLEVIQVYVTLRAVVEADRSTFGFIRVISIPLLLVVDMVLGYQLTTLQIFGVGLIVVAMLFLFIDHNFSKKGAGMVLFGAINAVATISLYKYNITHFNSVAAEQIVMLFILLLCLTFATFYWGKQNPFELLKHKSFFIQSFSTGVGGVITSFAYVYAPASIVAAAKRSSAILWATLSGNHYFKEKHIALKLSMFLLLTVGIALILQQAQ